MALAKPTQIAVPFANSGLKNSIPETATGSNLASMQEGFPTITMTDVDQGGMPPQGQDMNGILFDVTKAIQYQQAGGLFPYDATFAQAIDGYPLGALLTSADGTRLYQNTIAGNVSDPDNGGQNWRIASDENAVKFTAQTLTTDQQRQARSNIDSLGYTVSQVVNFQGGIRGLNVEGQTSDANDWYGNSGYEQIYYNNALAGANNISNLPKQAPFMLISRTARSGSNPRTTHQTCYTDGSVYTRIFKNGVWGGWQIQDIPYIDVRSYGAKGDGVTDDTASIKAAIEAGAATGKEVVFPAGKYIVSRIWQSGAAYPVGLRADGHVEIFSTATQADPSHADHVLGFTGTFGTQQNYVISSDIPAGAVVIPKAGLNVSAGDFMWIRGNQLVQGDSRSSWTRGGVFKIQEVSGSNLILENAIHTDFSAPSETDITVTEAIDTTHCKFSNVDASRDEMLYKVVVKSGVNVGKDPSFRWITDWDNDTKIATFAVNSMATGNSNGNKAWSVAPAVGDVFTLVKELNVVIGKPIEVHINGDFHITRNLITDGGANDLNGLQIQWAFNSSVDGVHVSNFPLSCIRLQLCYNSEVRNCLCENANDSSTGYAFSFSGNYGCRLIDCEAYGCRSGYSCGNGNTNDCYNIIEGLTVRAASLFVDTTGATMNPVRPWGYGWGDHGNGFKTIFRNCVGYDLSQATAHRGYKGLIENCSLYGAVQQFAWQNDTCGTTFKGCRLVPKNGRDPTCFMRIQSYIDTEPLSIIDCEADGITGHFVNINNENYVPNNLRLIGNRVRFDNPTKWLSGIGGEATLTDTRYILGKDCEIFDNVSWQDTQLVRGFFQPRYTCNVSDNIPVRTGMNRWYVKTVPNGDIEINMPQLNNSATRVTVTSGYAQSFNAIGMIFNRPSSDTFSPDVSPMAGSNKANLIVVVTDGVPVSGKLSVSFDYNGTLRLMNRTSTTSYLVVEAENIEGA